MKKLLQKVFFSRILLFGFVFCVCVPILLAYAVFVAQTWNNTCEDQIASDREKIDIVMSDIKRQMNEVENLVLSDVTSPDLIELLQADYFASDANYEKYVYVAQYIKNRLAAMPSSGLLKQRIFFTDERFPEGFGCFYSTDRVANRTWYQKFMADGRADTWIRLDINSDYNTFNGLLYEELYPDNTVIDRFVYVRRIFSYAGKLLGIFVMEVDDHFLFADYGLDNLYIVHDDWNRVLYKPNETLLRQFGGIERLFSTEPAQNAPSGFICSAKTQDGLQVRIGIIRTTRSLALLIQRYIGLSLILMALNVLLVLFYGFLMRYLLRMFTRALESIDHTIREDTPMLLPDMGNNEVGQVVRNFNDMSVRLQESIQERIDMEIVARDAQIHEMQMRISPHFFYNTLDVIASAMMIAGQTNIAEAMADFSKMMRIHSKRVIFLLSTKNCAVSKPISICKSYISKSAWSFK